jgi:hypothetical protein
MIRAICTFFLLVGALGASCFPSRSCLIFNPQTTVAFLGTVITQTALAGDKWGNPHLVRFRVTEILHGLPAGTREVDVEMGRWGAPQPENQQFLVEAKRNPQGVIRANTCDDHTGFFPNPPADSSVQYYREIRDGTFQPTLLVEAGSRYGAAGIRIAVEGQGVSRSLVAGEYGEASLKLPPGRYRVTASAPGYSSDTRTVTMVERKCQELRFQLEGTATVQGTLLSGGGIPLPHVEIVLTNKDRSVNSPLRATTNAAGRFKFTKVEPSTGYVLGTNLERLLRPAGLWTLAPRCLSERPVPVSPGEIVSALRLSCPVLGKVREVRVRVVDQRDRPVPNAEVESPYGRYRDGNPHRVMLHPLNTGADGSVIIRIVEGAILNIVARRNDVDSTIGAIPAKGSDDVVLRLRVP